MGNQNSGRALTARQLAAIRTAAELGESLRRDFPEIADDYRRGLTAPGLVARYEFDRLLGTSGRVAVAAVRNALRGHSGPSYCAYDGLIEDSSERRNLARAHNRQTGSEAHAGKRGIHALSREQKSEAGLRGGLIGGPLSFRLRIGCHAMPPEELRDHCRRIAPLGGKVGGVAAALAKGMVPYIPATPERPSEVEFILQLSLDPSLMGPVRANFKRIAQKVNDAFHGGAPRFTRTSLKLALQSHRRQSRAALGFEEDAEMKFAEALASDPAYQLPARLKVAEIARRANDAYHGGKPVRTPGGVRAALQRLRRQQPDPIPI